MRFTVKPLYQKEREVLNFHLSLQYENFKTEIVKKYIGMNTGYSTFDSFVPAPLIRRAFSACGDGKYGLRVSTPGFYRAYVNGE